MNNRDKYRERQAAKKQAKSQKLLQTENITLTFEYPPDILQAVGPIIMTQLSITEAHAAYLKANNLPIPSPVTCRFLVDTGATRSMVKHAFAERAGLKLINENTPIQGVGVDTTGKTYVGRIQFVAASKAVEGINHLVWIDAQITSGTLNDSELLDGLIGRDVLRHFDLRFQGHTGQMTMVYQRPRAPGK